jgi:hypothetical protein
MTQSAVEWLADTEKGTQIVASKALLISPLFETYRNQFSNATYSSCNVCILNATLTHQASYHGGEALSFLSKYGPSPVKQLLLQTPCPYLYSFAYNNKLTGNTRPLFI